MNPMIVRYFFMFLVWKYSTTLSCQRCLSFEPTSTSANVMQLVLELQAVL